MEMSVYLVAFLFVSFWINTNGKGMQTLHSYFKLDRGITKPSPPIFFLSYSLPISERRKNPFYSEASANGQQNNPREKTGRFYPILRRFLAKPLQENERGRDLRELSMSRRWFRTDLGFKSLAMSLYTSNKTIPKPSLPAMKTKFIGNLSKLLYRPNIFC